MCAEDSARQKNVIDVLDVLVKLFISSSVLSVFVEIAIPVSNDAACCCIESDIVAKHDKCVTQVIALYGVDTANLACNGRI